MSSISDSAKGDRPDSYRYIVVLALAFVYMLNFLDRQILSILAEPIKRDLGLSDTQLGLLTGLAFAMFYTAFGIPVAALADRSNRVRIIALACGAWSFFTAISGLATGFFSLALARIGVGIGEAGCSPPSYSVLSDYFPPSQRGRALGLYVLGVPVGSLVGTVAAGWIASQWSWRAAFVVVGIVGLLVAPLILLIVREPRRGQIEAAAQPATKATVSEATRFFRRDPALICNGIAAGFTALVSYGVINWAPAFLARVQDMTLGEIASFYSITVFAAMIGAAWLGAVISDQLGARDNRWYALAPGLGMVAVVPLLFGFTTAASWHGSLIWLLPTILLTSTYLVPALALLQNRAPPHLRATTSSILLLVINLVGLGCGPLVVGATSDWLAPSQGQDALRFAFWSLAPFAILAFAFQAASAWYSIIPCPKN